MVMVLCWYQKHICWLGSSTDSIREVFAGYLSRQRISLGLQLCHLALPPFPAVSPTAHKSGPASPETEPCSIAGLQASSSAPCIRDVQRNSVFHIALQRVEKHCVVSERERAHFQACADLYRFCAALLASCWAEVRFFHLFTFSLVRLKKPCDPLLGPADPSAPKVAPCRT